MAGEKVPSLDYKLVSMTIRIIIMTQTDTQGVGLQGAGSAAVFSTTFLWLETLIPVTNAIGAAYTIAWNIAVQVYSILIGQYIVSQPGVFIYLMSGTVGCCILTFGAANILAVSISKRKET